MEQPSAQFALTKSFRLGWTAYRCKACHCLIRLANSAPNYWIDQTQETWKWILQWQWCVNSPQLHFWVPEHMQRKIKKYYMKENNKPSCFCNPIKLMTRWTIWEWNNILSFCNPIKRSHLNCKQPWLKKNFTQDPIIDAPCIILHKLKKLLDVYHHP